MTRKLSAWNIFVKKVYTEGKAKDPNYEFKQALEDASKRKSEMGNSSSVSSKTAKKSRKHRKSRSRQASFAGGRKTMTGNGRKSRKHRRH